MLGTTFKSLVSENSKRNIFFQKHILSFFHQGNEDRKKLNRNPIPTGIKKSSFIFLSLNMEKTFYVECPSFAWIAMEKRKKGAMNYYLNSFVNSFNWSEQNLLRSGVQKINESIKV